MILSHMRYNSPVDSSTEQGDRGTEGRQREAGGGCLSVTSLSEKKKKAKTHGFFFAVANSFQSVKIAFYLLKELTLMPPLLIDNISVLIF